jgi:hypothetical protein
LPGTTCIVPVSEELLELVPGLVWAVLTPDGEAHAQPENLRLPTRPPRHKHKEPSPSFTETMLILVVIHMLFEYGR